MKNFLLFALVAIFAVAALLPLACSDDDDDDNDADDDATGDDDDDGACDVSLLPGLWSGTNYTMEIAEDLSYVAAGAPNLQEIQVSGQIEVDGCNLTIVDESGVYACPATDIGEYTFVVSETILDLTVVSDPCDGRRIPLDGTVLQRQ